MIRQISRASGLSRYAVSRSFMVGALAMLLANLVCGRNAQAQIASGPLHVHPTNPRYFADATGKAVYLTGSHTWSDLVDDWTDSFNITFDFSDYLSFLQQHHHNFIRLWRSELPQFKYADETEWRYSAPHPWKLITGGGDIIKVPPPGPGGIGKGNPGSGINLLPPPGNGEGGNGGGGNDSAPSKYDLTQFNQVYFDRLRDRCIAAGNQGIYCSIMLFEGYVLEHASEAWFSHPFNITNNINGINGDVNGDGKGTETHTLASPAVTELQELYVRKVIDTVNDLDNVMYEIANEPAADSIDWQNHFIDYVHAYEQTKPKQHPVLFSTPFPYGGSAMWQSNAEAVAPQAYSPQGSYADDPPPSDGSKVVISDSDHIFGCGGNSQWVWKSFTRGLNVIYMDSYYDNTPFCSPPNEGIRLNMGYTLSYADRMYMALVAPHGEWSSTAYCLAAPGISYLAYAPDGGSITLDLESAASITLNVEWFNPASGTSAPQPSINRGGTFTFSPPFSGQAVLFLWDPNNVPPPPPPPPPGNLIGDLNGDGVVNVDDLLILINSWGPCPFGPGTQICPADLNGDDVVNVDDLLKLINHWG